MCHAARRRPITRTAALVFASALLAACPASDGQQDAAPVEDADASSEQPVAGPDLRPDSPPITSYKVAAVQYSNVAYGKDCQAAPGCTNDICALSYFIKDARRNGAHLVLLPEDAFDQVDTYDIETAPAVGDRPGADARWKDGSITKTMAKLAVEQNMTVVFHLWTDVGGDKARSSAVAIEGSGKVVARHDKFQLFGSSESFIEPGTTVATSFFPTPAGKAGMLVCADVQCLITGMQEGPSCTASANELLKQFFDVANKMKNKPDLILFTELWMGTGSVWGAVPVQKSLAKNGAAYVVAANNTAGTPGGGVFKPDGTALVIDQTGKPMVLYAELPLK
jgi:predicted amidohydrolase